MHRFLVIFEKADNNYSAYVPDLPGCVATGSNREETELSIHTAIKLHLEGMREDNIPIPGSDAFAEFIAVE
ncbi:MAG: type II toxin-antitoxin system HicB family antitoxin [FCB group bacterium]|nr:type II toxin-antitoxin system HicB family antitoxin [FCB group bacterium]